MTLSRVPLGCGCTPGPVECDPGLGLVWQRRKMSTRDIFHHMKANLDQELGGTVVFCSQSQWDDPHLPAFAVVPLCRLFR